MISKDNNDLSSYSVPEESAKCLWNGILSHPGHTNLPVECRENFDRIKFVGKRLPTMAISWRFAESGAALKGFEASLLNVLLNRKYGIDPPEITIDPDHAQLFLMSFFLVEVDPKGPNAPVRPSELRELNRTHAKHFPSWDLHHQVSSPYRKAVHTSTEPRMIAFTIYILA